MSDPTQAPPPPAHDVLAMKRLAEQMAKDSQKAKVERTLLLRRQQSLQARGWGHRLPQPLLRQSPWQRLKHWLVALWR